ncbi:flagellar hook assembly protein FlgD [Chthonobacter albigriseus]|uniref:flagellar hook assembly protein FlgD n=1 Tax=Chthonobacter albigriseus TaxID=1683161 RepID=UPI0015EF28EC|nr:flagellar hook assembly protein FlgD [Chthonobacter albigriseus]
MAVTSATGTTTTPATTSNTSETAKRLATTYDTFLKMLTTQLKVQNPLEPMDAEKFTEQLVQYSGVEQQIQTNKNLESILASLASTTSLNLVNYIGKSIEASGDTTLLEGGKATWKANAASVADKVKVTITDSTGTVVFTGTTTFSSGDNTYEWDGKTDAGGDAPAGNYKIAFDAEDSDGKAVAVSTRMSGKVTAIDTSGSEPYLYVGTTAVPISGVSRISG